MTVIEQIRDEVTDKAGMFAWSAALVYALGNPSEWEYTGTVTEAGPMRVRYYLPSLSMKAATINY